MGTTKRRLGRPSQAPGERTFIDRKPTLMTVTLDKSVEDFVATPRQLFIDGRWVDAASGRTFATPNPATGRPLAQVAEADAEDVERAVRAARRAFDGPWSRLTPSERGRLIWKIGDLILEHADELAQLESLDNGKPLAVARAADIPLSADMFHYMAGWATKIEGNTITPSVPYMPGAAFHAYTLREPIGVIGQIIPWNFPLLMAAWKLAPALATGNTVILKPAEQTPLTALRLAELIAEAGVPDGVVNVLPGYGETAGAALAAHDGVDKVAFTGSTEVGKLIVHAAAGNLKKVSLELGGKSPNIVFDDADPELAVQGAANAIFFNHGQCCVAGSRLFVQQSHFEQVVEGVADIARGIRLGSGLEPGTQMGPLVSDEQLQRVTGYLDSGRSEGARTVVGGARHGDQGYFVQPTVITDTHPEMKIVREEIFGPVVVASPFSDLDEIAAQANDTTYGLGAGIWTRDISKAHALASKLRAGTVWINCYNVFDAALPFGGYKQSGWGREMGHEVLEAYTEVKAVCTQL
ncbi:aldehyde dehydrogenase family protein [Nonomuraea sp. NPDC003707]